MSFKMDGFDELDKQLKKMEKGARELEQTGSVPLSELFTTTFMKENTTFSSIEEFFERSPFDVSTEESFDAINKNEIDEYVVYNSNFKSWQDMLGLAGEEYAIKKLGL